jgi:hypothetical protein
MGGCHIPAANAELYCVTAGLDVVKIKISALQGAEQPLFSPYSSLYTK